MSRIVRRLCKNCSAKKIDFFSIPPKNPLNLSFKTNQNLLFFTAWGPRVMNNENNWIYTKQIIQVTLIFFAPDFRCFIEWFSKIADSLKDMNKSRTEKSSREISVKKTRNTSRTKSPFCIKLNRLPLKKFTIEVKIMLEAFKSVIQILSMTFEIVLSIWLRSLIDSFVRACA